MSEVSNGNGNRRAGRRRTRLTPLELALAVALSLTLGVAALLAHTTYQSWQSPTRMRTEAHGAARATTSTRADDQVRPDDQVHADNETQADNQAPIEQQARADTESFTQTHTTSLTRVDARVRAFDATLVREAVAAPARREVGAPKQETHPPKRRLGHCTESNGDTDWRSQFTASTVGRSTLYVGAGVSPVSVELVRANWPQIQVRVSIELGFVAEAPDVFLHASPARLRAATCSDALTVALYDGGIHVATNLEGAPASREIVSSLTHEYVHHVLFRNQIREPWWFHEGAAMHIGGDEWEEWKLHDSVLEPEAMVVPPPNNLVPLEREARYGLAYLMAGFVEERCRQYETRLVMPTDEPLHCSGHELTRALRAGMKPEQLFWWAAEHWSSLEAEPARRAWSSYLARHR